MGERRECQAKNQGIIIKTNAYLYIFIEIQNHVKDFHTKPVATETDNYSDRWHSGKWLTLKIPGTSTLFIYELLKFFTCIVLKD